ncbi:MAG: hypothetical protein NVSMB12_14850 [Acidimicrobiales bacterium]
MKIFLSGATGVLGRRTLALLVAAGHDVTAVARSTEKADAVRRAGAHPVQVDLFDPVALREAVAGHDAVCNLATHIPAPSRSLLPGAWAENDRIRRDGVKNLVDAALAGGVGRIVQESITFVYADGGSAWLDEDAPLAICPPTASTVAAEESVARFTAGGRIGVVLRFGYFYGPDSIHTQRQLQAARQGIAASVGAPDGYQPFIHLDDAAAAVVAALDAPAGIYNVVEDRPGTRAEIATAMADALGVAPLWVPPKTPVLPSIAYAGFSQRVSNRRFREATGWVPAYPSPREGWAAVVSQAGVGAAHVGRSDRGRRFASRLALAYLAAGALPLAVWATFSPKGWFEGFPGLGRHWVGVDGPYNHHLAGEIGALYLALLTVTVVAACSRSRLMARTAGAAWVIGALPHFLYHLGHRSVLGTGDQVASLGGLALEVVLGSAVVVLAPPTRPARPVPAAPIPARTFSDA